MDTSPVNLPTSLGTARMGAWAVGLGSGIWGLFWIALRALDELGLHGLWAISAVTFSACLPALWLAIRSGQLTELRHRDTWLTAGPLGLSLVLYFVGVLAGDVIRVIFLFYLLPVWTLLAAHLLFREPVTRHQVIVIAVALFGLWLLLTEAKQALPWPESLSDWCGIGSGMLWGLSLAVLRGRRTIGPCASTASAMIVSFVAATVLGMLVSFLLNDPRFSWPAVTSANQTKAVVLSLLFGATVMYPAMLGQVWGARLIKAPTAALLTMTELIVAVISAYFIVGTELGPISTLGGVLIVSVVLFDVARTLAAEKKSSVD